MISCFVSQRYWKMKAIHNKIENEPTKVEVVLYPKDTEKWKQFTTKECEEKFNEMLFCIPKILKNESNSQHRYFCIIHSICCFVSQRYWKMKAIHNYFAFVGDTYAVVLYPKDTEKWKQFKTE